MFLLLLLVVGVQAVGAHIVVADATNPDQE